MYATDTAWQRTQRFLPPKLRVGADTVPSEEWWSWRGFDVHLDRHADAGAPLKLVALHGGGGNGRLLAPVGIGARGRAETVVPDLPGYGHTRAPRRHVVTYDDWVDVVTDLVAAEQERDGRPVVLFGASMGGLLAYDVACRRPDVRGVIATCFLDPSDDDAMRAAARHPLLTRVTSLVVTLDPLVGAIRVPMRLLVNMRAIANDPGLTGALIADRTAAGSTLPLRFLASFMGSRRPVAPEEFTRPVLLVHPGADRWTPPVLSRRFLDRIAGTTRYVELDKCGHAPVEEPGISQMHEAIAGFLDELAEPN